MWDHIQIHHDIPSYTFLVQANQTLIRVAQQLALLQCTSCCISCISLHGTSTSWTLLSPFGPFPSQGFSRARRGAQNSRWAKRTDGETMTAWLLRFTRLAKDVGDSLMMSKLIQYYSVGSGRSPFTRNCHGPLQFSEHGLIGTTPGSITWPQDQTTKVGKPMLLWDEQNSIQNLRNC